MDQRAHDVEEDLKTILHTRLALADKLQLLEKRVDDTVQGTKAAALEALDLARNKAVDLIESATHSLSPSVQSGRRPWIMVGSAVAIGFFAGWMEPRRRRSGVYAYYPPEAAGAGVMPSKGRGQGDAPSGVYPFYSARRGHPPSVDRPTGRSDQPTGRTEDPARSTGRMADIWKPFLSLWNDFTGELTHERTRLQQAALLAGRSFLHDVARIAGQSLLDQLINRSSSSSSQREGQRRTLDG